MQRPNLWGLGAGGRGQWHRRLAGVTPGPLPQPPFTNPRCVPALTNQGKTGSVSLKDKGGKCLGLDLGG